MNEVTPEKIPVEMGQTVNLESRSPIAVTITTIGDTVIKFTVLANNSASVYVGSDIKRFDIHPIENCGEEGFLK
ncbi:hypothetical protein [Pseudoalteromonas luteoviolacea]|uniref:Uncharacterized protein n=1 Tax=Pseudoalteromonas luteoviolacea NCIMB 1942 TaxID=1365253 RepID=A0A167I1E0_9GAMM|nr:hypothetical protein [Pseudoalteromonas luteoviolacea]KZN58787.1 hypothetical protein N482_04160 [Pseudoalteromonas luteoviolacea NCIMB 1942]